MDRKRLAGVVVASLTVVLGVAPASAANLSQQKASTHAQLQAVQAQLSSNLTSDAQVEAIAGRLQAALAAQQIRVDDARSVETEATTEVVTADRQLVVLATKTTTERAALVHNVVSAYEDPYSATTNTLSALFNVTSAYDLAVRQGLIGVANQGLQNHIDAYRFDQASLQVARITLEAKRQRAASVTRAEQLQESTLADTAAAQEAAHAALQAHIADLRHESAVLGTQESRLQALIQAQEAADAAAAQRSGQPVGSTSAQSSAGRQSAAGLIWPLHGVVTSEYGPRWGSFHPGIDISASYGAPIHAAKAGVVIYAAYCNGGYGNFVIIDHGGGMSTGYGHQSQIAVSAGERVSQGQLIGYEGSTGDSTGPHVHFEVRINGSPRNPRDYESGNP